ncbi:MAG: hypothetical protein QUS33_01305 [Dehalococcoidia bacterium]|nr:hypothetical protein [Dehalococcoidia bacterium]
MPSNATPYGNREAHWFPSTAFTVFGRAIRAIHGWTGRRFSAGPRNMEEMLEWAVRHDEYSVYSFDIFDTLLRRRVDPPEEVKRLVAVHVAQRLAARGMEREAAAIVAERNKVERSLQQAAISKGLDAVAFLDDIMAGTLKSIGAEGLLDWQDIVNYELALEKAATEPMPGVQEVLACLRADGKRVVAVSETYLSAAQMASLLEHHGLLRFFEKLSISCELGKSKLTGNLFRHLRDNEPGKLVHIGDNYDFDYRVPRNLGLKSLWFHSRDEQRRRRALRKLAAGRNRLAYVNCLVGSADKDRPTLYQIGHDVLGPALTVFVHCVAERARRDRIERLFFVARDGYVMKKIYAILAATIYQNETVPAGEYLCLSRLPVRAASAGAFGLAHVLEAYHYLADSPKRPISMADILTSYGMNPAAFAAIARQHQLDIDASVPGLPENANVRRLVEDADFQRTATAQALAATGLLRSYLTSAGFMGKGKVALVDANSEGLTQSLMAMVFRNDPQYPEVRGYYFCLINLGLRPAPVLADTGGATGFVSDWRTAPPSDHSLFKHFGMVIELFSHPNHGVTIGYKNIGDRTVPLFRRTPQESQYHLTSQGLQGILDYARAYGARYNLHQTPCDDLLPDIRHHVKEWVSATPSAHLKALEGLLVTSDWPRETSNPIVHGTFLGTASKMARRALRQFR